MVLVNTNYLPWDGLQEEMPRITQRIVGQGTQGGPGHGLHGAEDLPAAQVVPGGCTDGADPGASLVLRHERTES